MEHQKSNLAAVYARVSGDSQKKDETIESQIDAIQAYAKANNYNIVNEWIFKDEAVSGKYLERPALDALRDLIHEGGPDIIIIHEPDRLARKNAYQVLLLEEFEKQGVKVQFVKCKPAETPEEQFTISMLGVYAEYERAKILDRCRRGRLYKAKMGKLSIIPQAPYGFIRHKESSVFEIDIEKSKVVKDIFFLYTHKNYSLGAIAKHLDVMGVPTPGNGKHWERSTLRDILKNESYIGTAYFGKTEKYEGVPNRIIRYNGKKVTKPKDARKERPKDVWIPIQTPGFISENDFQLAQEKLEENKKFSVRNTKELSLLQGLLVCNECGRSFYKKSRGKYCYYCCNSSLQKGVINCGNKTVRQDEIDSMVWNEIIRLLGDSSLVEQEIARRIEENTKDSGDQLKRAKIEKELSQLSKAKDKLLDAYQEGDCITLDELRKRIEKIKIKTNELEKSLKFLNSLEMQYENAIDIKATLEHLSKKLIASSTELTLNEKQKVIRLLIEEVVIGKESIRIKHCIPINGRLSQISPLGCASYIKA